MLLLLTTMMTSTSFAVFHGTFEFSIGFATDAIVIEKATRAIIMIMTKYRFLSLDPFGLTLGIVKIPKHGYQILKFETWIGNTGCTGIRLILGNMVRMVMVEKI